MEKIYIKWRDMQSLMYKMRLSSKSSDPVALFKWNSIGLKLDDECDPVRNATKGWCFLIINKNKLVHAMMQHEFTL